MAVRKIKTNKKLVSAFKKYQKRSTSGGKISWKNFLPEILFRTMRLEGEHITRKEAKALFR